MYEENVREVVHVVVVFDLPARGQEWATARGRTPRQRTRSERGVPPLRGASSFCVDTHLTERPVVPQRLRPRPVQASDPPVVTSGCYSLRNEFNRRAPRPVDPI